MVTWFTWVRGLSGLRGSNFYVGCVGYMGQNSFYVGQHFTLVIIFTWVAWVKYIFVWVICFCVGLCVGLCMGQNFLRGSIFFVLVNFYLLDDIILLYCN